MCARPGAAHGARGEPCGCVIVRLRVVVGEEEGGTVQPGALFALFFH